MSESRIIIMKLLAVAQEDPTILEVIAQRLLNVVLVCTVEKFIVEGGLAER